MKKFQDKSIKELFFEMFDDHEGIKEILRDKSTREKTILALGELDHYRIGEREGLDHREFEMPGALKKKITILNEIVRRESTKKLNPHDLIIDHPHKVTTLFCRLGYKSTEEFHALYLDNYGRLIAQETLAMGNEEFVSCSMVDIFHYAVKYLARGIVIVHNHPSGNPIPSDSDIAFTRKIYRNSLFMNINMMDHVIVSRNSYFSFREQNLLGRETKRHTK